MGKVLEAGAMVSGMIFRVFPVTFGLVPGFCYYPPPLPCLGGVGPVHLRPFLDHPIPCIWYSPPVSTSSPQQPPESQPFESQPPEPSLGGQSLGQQPLGQPSELAPESPADSSPSQQPQARRSLGTIAAIVGVATLLSKVFGLVRQQAIAAAFGTGAAFDAFNYAYVVPGFLLILLGGINGPFHSAIVSVLSKERQTKRRLKNSIL